MTLEEMAENYYPEFTGKLVRADLLLAYIFHNHEHVESRERPVVDSPALEEFIRNSAVR